MCIGEVWELQAGLWGCIRNRLTTCRAEPILNFDLCRFQNLSLPLDRQYTSLPYYGVAVFKDTEKSVLRSRQIFSD